MSVEERRPPSELDEFLARAVDRQIAEQRALRETLAELRDAIKERQDAGRSDEPLITPSDLDEIRDGLRELGETIREGAPAPVDDGSALESVKEAVAGVSSDIEGIAQALIDLNRGLRTWAEGMEQNVVAIRRSVEDVLEIAESGELTPPAQPPLRVQAALPEATDDDELIDDEDEDDLPPPLAHAAPVASPASDLSTYLADQIDDLDRALDRMGELPTKIEGVVAQALRRTLAARAKLDQQASNAMDETLAVLDEHVETMTQIVTTLSDKNDALSSIAGKHSEIDARLEALAAAVDRLAAGGDPRASETVGAAAPRRSGARKGQGAKGPAARKKTSKTVRSAKPVARRKTSRRPNRSGD